MDKNLLFKGLWAVILGGSSGFGYAAAEKLAKNGMNIAVLYRENKTADNALKENLAQIALTSKRGPKLRPRHMPRLTSPLPYHGLDRSPR